MKIYIHYDVEKPYFVLKEAGPDKTELDFQAYPFCPCNVTLMSHA